MNVKIDRVLSLSFNAKEVEMLLYFINENKQDDSEYDDSQPESRAANSFATNLADQLNRKQ